MELIFPRSSRRRFLDVYIACLGAITIAYGLLTAKVSRSWAIADWLINYQGGFVRRGLPGEVAFLMGRALHISPVPIVVLFYLSLYAVIFLSVRALALRTGLGFWVCAILLSPATLSFQVLDATAGFRKESIYLAALAIFAVFLRRFRGSEAAVSAAITAVSVAAVLSHEALVCFIPYFFALLVASGHKPRSAAATMVVPLLLGSVAAVLCSRHIGDASTAARICASLGYKLRPQASEICSGGAIQYLMVSRAMARAQTAELVRSEHYFRVYGCTMVLALLPLIGASIELVRTGFRLEVRALWITAAISFAASLVLFVYAEDWGRWIYIHVMSLAIVLLSLEGWRQTDEKARAPSLGSGPVSPGWKPVLATLALAAYTTLWTLPHVPALTPRFGYPGLVRYMLQYRGSHPGVRI